MESKILPTEFASAERSSQTKINRQHHYFSRSDLAKKLADSVPDIVLILNENRQIVCANQLLLHALKQETLDAIIAKRPGEALNCIHADKTEGGCGTTEFCKTCGAVKAILASQKGSAAVQECRILQKNGNALDLRVWATPLVMEEDKFTIFAAKDISDEKRRRALERIFFHDVLNTAGGLQGFAQMLYETTEEDPDEMITTMYHISETLIDEINAQKALMAAETNDLKLNITDISSAFMLKQVSGAYKNHIVAEEKTIKISGQAEDVIFQSDLALVKRVIGNMLKNALEASKNGDTVILSCKKEENKIQFTVQNPVFIPRDIQLQIFQRSFSTKGAGRGLGTYSMKLLSERYLKGEIGFTSEEQKGTQFFVTYPVVWHED